MVSSCIRVDTWIHQQISLRRIHSLNGCLETNGKSAYIPVVRETKKNYEQKISSLNFVSRTTKSSIISTTNKFLIMRGKRGEEGCGNYGLINGFPSIMNNPWIAGSPWNEKLFLNKWMGIRREEPTQPPLSQKHQQEITGSWRRLCGIGLALGAPHSIIFHQKLFINERETQIDVELLEGLSGDHPLSIMDNPIQEESSRLRGGV